MNELTHPPLEPTRDAAPEGPVPAVRYDFEDDAPPHLPPEMYEDWRAEQLRMRGQRQTHGARWRRHTLLYGGYGALVALVTISLVRVGNEWFKLPFALVCGAAAWLVVARRWDRFAGMVVYGGTASLLVLSGVASGVVHPIGVVLVIVYLCAGAALPILADNRRWNELDPF